MRSLTVIVVLLHLYRVTNASSKASENEVSNSFFDLIRPEHRENTIETQRCSFLPVDRIREANLTAEETEVLPLICWKSDAGMSDGLLTSVRKGIPSGVKCKATQW